MAALLEAQELIVYVGYCSSIKEYQKTLIRYINSRGGGPDGGAGGKEYHYIANLYPDLSLNRDISCDLGPIAISPDGITSLEDAADGTLVIDFDNSIIDNGCWYGMNLFDYVDEYLDGDDTDLYLPSIDVYLGNIYFHNLDTVINTLTNVDAYMMPDKDYVIKLIA